MSNLSELLPSGGGQNLVEFVASGTLPSGKPVILNSNGTVTVVAESTVSESIPAGSAYTFDAGAANYTACAFDPNDAGKFVLVYPNLSNGEYGTAIVGTVSGTAISFGSEYVFNSANSIYMSMSFDAKTAGMFVISFYDTATGSNGTSKALIGNISGTTLSFGTKQQYSSQGSNSMVCAFDPNTAGKFVIAHRDGPNSNNGRAIVATVSGTTISYGSSIAFNAAGTTAIGISFDPNTSGMIVIAFKDEGDGEYGKAIVGNIAGTSITFGSEYTFNSTNTEHCSCAFDPNTAGKFVVAYSDQGNSRYGTCIVGTVSGTAISYGSEYIFNNSHSNRVKAYFDPYSANKFVVTYTPETASNVGKVIVGTISGTAISYGSATTYNSISTDATSTSFDPSTPGKFVIVYRNNTSPYAGKAIVGQMTAAVTNLTSANLIGITSEATSSGGTAKINTWGGINEAQTSLTIASDYYAQTNGTITTATAGQKVGTAISATTINMKDLT